MTRPKVDPEKRQRTANACDSCKRRKQKCDGQQPCPTCSRKQFTCTYTTPEQRDGDISASESHSKKRFRSNEDPVPRTNQSAGRPLPTQPLSLSPWPASGNLPYLNDATRTANVLRASDNVILGAKTASEHGSSSGGDEEVDNHTMTRMLDDGAGKLIYMGDSATLSFLQLLRVIVESVVGPTIFSSDPGRHGISENHFSLLPDVQLTHQLPSKETTMILVDAFFVNTHALIQIFDETAFLATLDEVYSDPLTIDRKYLCHLNLVLAIGYCLAIPSHGSREAAIVNIVRSKQPNQSEVFYQNARRLSDFATGLADGEKWSIQTLLLMAAYMMYRCKRNVAYSFVGMAVRTAYSLGLHREETLSIFPLEEQVSRKRLWRSLFIVDRLLATYLGRPVAIAEEECSSELLNPRKDTIQRSIQFESDQFSSAGLEATARSAHVIGLILRKVYLQRRISTKMAQSLADECKRWPESLPPALHWRRATSKNRRQAIAILHCNLAYCHSIILLSRPFFLYILTSDIQTKHFGKEQRELRSRGRMEKFSDACIIASIHVIALVQNAYEGRYLAQLDSPASYCLLSASLVIFADKFARPSSSALSNQCMANAISILSFCGEMDPQAKRAARVLTEFRDVIRQQENRSTHPPQLPAFQDPLQGLAANASGSNSMMPTYDRGFTPIPPLPGAGSFPAVDPTSSMSANTLNSTVPDPFTLPMDDCFSGLLDLNNTVLPTFSDQESSGPDEAIDFDALWGEWPGDLTLPDFGAAGNMPLQSANTMPVGETSLAT